LTRGGVGNSTRGRRFRGLSWSERQGSFGEVPSRADCAQNGSVSHGSTTDDTCENSRRPVQPYRDPSPVYRYHKYDRSRRGNTCKRVAAPSSTAGALSGAIPNFMRRAARTLARSMRGLDALLAPECFNVQVCDQPLQGAFSRDFASKRAVDTWPLSAKRVLFGTGILVPRGWRLSLARFTSNAQRTS